MAESGTAATPKPSSSVKLVLLGEAAVGKSSLVMRFVNNDFQENKEPTIGAAFLTQKCNLPTRTIKFEIWDTAGQERFASLAPMYYRNAQAALVVYDITKASSFTKAQHWVVELQRQASPGIVIALVGNKFDLVDTESGVADTEAASPPATPDDVETAAVTVTAAADDDDLAAAPAVADEDASGEHNVRKVAIKKAKSYADDENLLFFETSAKSGHNVTEVFDAIAIAIPVTSLKGSRGVGTGQGATGRGEDSARVNLSSARDTRGPKDGCAC